MSDRHADGVSRLCEVCGDFLAVGTVDGRWVCVACGLWAIEADEPRGATDAEVRQATENVGR